MTHYNYSPLLTDFYQLTMSYGYWRLGMHEQEAAFHLLFRKNPFKGNYALSCGLGSVVEFLNHWRFQDDDLNYLANIKDQQNNRLFPQDFLDYLQQLTFTCDIDAIPEGSIVFPQEPLLRIQGPLIQCQLLESTLLNILNFQSLIASKASRVCRAAACDPVIEFGLRRAQGPDGAISASRAAYIGGCVATSNTLAGKLFDIPLRGTHAHSWVTAFPSEMEAFTAYADVLPQNCVLLVDTYNTLEGVKNAIKIGERLRHENAQLLAVRLDSGNMAELSIKARNLLDQAGFQETAILASNSLDEYAIEDCKKRGAKISMWGVGTNLVTAYDQPALDGVYKLAALKTPQGKWEYKLKLSEQEIKISNPGRHQIRRFYVKDQSVGDVIYDLDLGITEKPQTVLFDHSLSKKQIDQYDRYEDLLQPLFRAGKLVSQQPSIHNLRTQAIAAATDFYAAHGNSSYEVGLELKLFELKQQLIAKFKK